MSTVAALAGFNHLAAADTPRPDRKVIAESVDKLARLRPGPEEDRAIADLVRNGVAAVEEISRQLATEPVDFGRVHRSVIVLKGVNSEKSRTLLRRIALGEMTGGNPNLEAWAAQALIACDGSEVWKLLASSKPQVLTTALNAVGEQPLNQERAGMLVDRMKHEDVLVSGLSAKVLAGAATGRLSDEAAAGICRSLAAVSTRPEAKVVQPDNRKVGTAVTPADTYYGYYIPALVSLRVDNAALRELAKGLTGRAQDAVTVALAWRGDATVRPDVLKIALNMEAGMFRMWAVHGLRTVGTRDDLPLLRKLRESDPLAVEGGMQCLGPPGPRFVVRDAAKDAISAIENRK
ncbi:hypothetical protein FRUB_00205 [Fimbriiglobus ruber]|uniref:HEAT repeat domain-containing protein n=2 Tax=Fimbriiglobus ruber TaxID=1908690 RepID=A0A225E8V5_9BACT|nr:hypothetical protein FRUB_00205 [Fimbriiglobus ruber]